MKIAFALSLVALLAAAVPVPALALSEAPRFIAAAGRWGALAGAGQCDAASLSLLPATANRLRGRASISFDRAARHGEFAAALSKPVAPGAAVMLTIDDAPFLLVARGLGAWSRGPAQEIAIIAALRTATRIKIEGRTPRGVRFIDRYDPSGAATAIDAAAACAAGL